MSDLLDTMQKRHELIQYASDLHLECMTEPTIDFETILFPACPILVLAGDICLFDVTRMNDFMKYCSSRWEHVICVAGNHEYYNQKSKKSWETYYDVKSITHKEMYMNYYNQKYPNVHWLQEDYFDIPNTDIRILGCTLWADYDESLLKQIHESINDFNYICISQNKPAVPHDLKMIHHTHVGWLISSLRKCELLKKRVVVVTHHLPLYQVVEEKFQEDPLKSAYASQLDKLFEMPALYAWICGHSHSVDTYRYERKDGTTVPCALNCRGYPDKKHTLYSAFKVLDIPVNRKKIMSSQNLLELQQVPKSPTSRSPLSKSPLTHNSPTKGLEDDDEILFV